MPVKHSRNNSWPNLKYYLGRGGSPHKTVHCCCLQTCCIWKRSCLSYLSPFEVKIYFLPNPWGLHIIKILTLSPWTLMFLQVKLFSPSSHIPISVASLTGKHIQPPIQNAISRTEILGQAAHCSKSCLSKPVQVTVLAEDSSEGKEGTAYYPDLFRRAVAAMSLSLNCGCIVFPSLAGSPFAKQSHFSSGMCGV